MPVVKYSEIVGLPVLCIETGKRVGIVKDVIFIPVKKCVYGFQLERTGADLRNRLIRLDDVASIGSDAMVINSRSCIITAKDAENDEEYESRGKVIGLRIFTKTGRDLGVIEDVLFDCTTGRIEGVEISDGLFQDIMTGRKLLPLFGKYEFSDESLLVDRDATEEITETGGGLAKLINGGSQYHAGSGN